MFLPPAFVEPDPATAATLLRQTGFGHLVLGGGLLASTPMPYSIETDTSGVRTIRAHLAKANPVLRSMPAEALLIVTPSDAYISPSWYATKAETGKVVPTWNYEVVHVRGRVERRDEPEWILEQASRMTDEQEAARDEPWSVSDAPPAYVEKLLGAIVGVEMMVDEVVAKRKLSQNKTTADIDGAADGLDAVTPQRSRVSAAMREARR